MILSEDSPFASSDSNVISVDDSGNVAVLNPNGANDGKYMTIAIRYDNAVQNIGLIVGSMRFMIAFCPDSMC